MTTLTPNTPLRDFLRDVFHPQRLTTRVPVYAATYQTAIDWFARTLGREPLIGDLTTANVRRVMRYCADHGNREHWVRKMRDRLGTMWKYAQRLGIVSNYQAVSACEHHDERMRFLLTTPPADSVRGYYLTHRRGELRQMARQDNDAAVKNLDTFAGRYVMLSDVTAELLSDFAWWLALAGKSQSRQDRFCGAIRSIVHHHDPSRFRQEHVKPEPLPTPPDGSVRHLFLTRYAPERMLDCTPRTVAACTRCVERLYEHYGRDVMLNELTDSLAADHFRWLKADRGLQHSSINSTHRATLFAVWRFAVEIGLKDRDPRIRKLKELHHEPDSWDLDEVNRLLAATSIFAGSQWPGVVPRDAFWRALLLVEWWTALRLSSILQIKRANLNRETGWLYIDPSTAKNRRGKKLRLGDDALEAIAAIWEPDRELLFPWPLRRGAVWRHFRRLQKAAGLPDNCPLSTRRFHKLRRTVATYAAVHAGMPAAIALLDHSGPEITRRYLDPSKLAGTDATLFLPMLQGKKNT